MSIKMSSSIKYAALFGVLASSISIATAAGNNEPQRQNLSSEIETAQRSAWEGSQAGASRQQVNMDQEAVAYISKSNGDIINPYKEIYEYLAEVKTHPPGADRDQFIGAIRQTIEDNMISLSEYVFLQTKYAEYQNKTWKMRLLADLSKQKR